jgi:hypothetical protein
VSRWWPALRAERAATDIPIPGFVERAFADLLTCGVPEAGFIRLRCPDCHVERAVAFSCKHRGLCPSCGARRMHDVTSHLMERVFPEVPIRQYVLSPPSELVGLLAAREDVLAAMARVFVQSIFRGQGARLGRAVHGGAVVFVQRFTKTLSVYPHLHVLALDGGYGEDDEGALEFHADPGPSPASRAAMEAEVETRLSGWLGRRGYLDEGSAPRPDDGWWLSGAGEPSGVSARGPRRVRSGFEVHTSVRVRADDRLGRAQLIRYVSRPPFAEAQVEVVDEEQVRFVLRSPSRSGQGELRLHPLALLRRLAWLVPPPRQHQVRAFGVLAPAARLRPKVVPVGRVAVQGRWFGAQRFEPTERVPYREAWSRLLSRVYDVDGHACPRCPGRLRPFGAVLPPEAAEWVRRSQFVGVESTGPPPRGACR